MLTLADVEALQTRLVREKDIDFQDLARHYPK